MTIYALPSSMIADLIPAIVEIENSQVTEEFCFICGRCTDHRGEHSDKQLLDVFDMMQRCDNEARASYLSFVDEVIDEVFEDPAPFYEYQFGDHNWNWT